MNKLIVVAALLLPIAAVAQDADSTDGVDIPRPDERSSEGAVTWTAPLNTLAPLDVRTEGSLIEAVNATNTNAGSVTVNGVVFSNSTDLLSYSTDEMFVNRATTGDPGYDRLLGTLDFGSGSKKVALTVGGGLLTPGHNYLIQVWWTDARNCCNNPRQMAIGDGLENSVILDSYGANKLGQYAVGLFTAEDQSHILTLETAGGSAFAKSGNAHITAYQIRSVSFQALAQLRVENSSAPSQTESPQAVTKSNSHDTGIYDALGNRIFYFEGELLFDDSGHEYYFDTKWDRTSKDGGVMMNYRFNQRQWEWVEGVPMKKSPLLADRVDKDSIRRIYKSKNRVLTTTEQGSYPILSFRDGNYVNEFGEPVYSLSGFFPGWASIILLHHYYEQVYKSDAIVEINARRAVAADIFANSNSLAVDVFKWGTNYETRRKNKKMIYFTAVEGEIFVLSEEQIIRIKNGWLILNEKPWLGSGSTVKIPEASFYLSKRKAKKAGVQGIESDSVVLQLKARPEHMTELREAISQ